MSTERWCRLRGNLLFYFKSRDHWSEPAGVIVLENCQVTLDNTESPPFAFNLVFDGGQQHCAALCEGERDAWIAAIHQASFSYMRSLVEALQAQVWEKQELGHPQNIQQYRQSTGLALDVNEAPFLEMSMSCDNLRCDGDGQPPSPRVAIQVLTAPSTTWLNYSQTEIIERTSNPNFLSTVSFRSSDGLDNSTKVRLVVYDVRERVTNTTTELGQANVSLGGLRETGRTRLSLQSPVGRTIGFITVVTWTLEPESVDASHTPNNATPIHQPCAPPVACHRRTQSLPPRLSTKTRHPTQGHISLLFDNPSMATYRFHSGLGGDIAVLEVMAESKLCFTLPQQLLGLWISEERGWQEELSSLGDLSDQWHSRQMALLNQHVTLINIYNMALDSLDVAQQSGSSFKKSSDKGEASIEMAPTNLHLQRLWVQNESLRRSGFYDVITHGAFTAYSQGFKNGGLVNMLQKAKSSRRSPDGCDVAWVSEAAVEGVKRLRQEVTALLRTMLISLKQEETSQLQTLLAQLQEKTTSLLSIIEPSLVDEAFEFLDKIRVPQNPSRILTLASRSYSTHNIEGYLSPEAALDMELLSPEGTTPAGVLETNLDCDTYTIVNRGPIDIMDGAENSVYRPTDEPEPWDLIQLNVQASVMCLSSKIKSFCNKKECKDDTMLENSVSLEDDKAGINNDLDESKLQETVLPSVNKIVVKEAPKSSPKKVVIKDEDQSLNSHNTSVTVMGSSASSETSQSSALTVSSGVGSTKQTESQQSSCSVTPDVSPLEEDSGISLERRNSEVERTDWTSEGGLSLDELKRDELPLDKAEVRQIECDDLVANTELKYISDKTGKLESIMERSLEDLNGLVTSYDSDKENENAEDKNLNNKDNSVDYADKVSIESPKSISSSISKTQEENKFENIKNIVCTNDSDVSSENRTKANSVNDKSVSANEIDEVLDWVGEVRPSMRKLRQAMDGLMRTARLVHSVFRLQQTPEAAQKSHSIKHRRDVCFSQALTSLVTGLMTRLWCRKADPLFITILSQLGPLAEFECLLSCHGSDASMLSDMVVAVEDLGTVEFVMITAPGHQGGRTRGEGHGPQQLQQPRVSGNRSGLRVVLPVPEHVMSLLPNQQIPNDPPSFRVTPVLFNIGINEEASLAEKLGTDGPQTRNNQDSYERLAQYYHRFKKLPLPQDNNRRVPSMGSEVPLVDLIDKLGLAVHSQRSKNPEVLALASQCCRAMAGLRFTSCKSGKDRTGMSCTLEQSSILASEYDLSSSEYQRALNCMRSEGTRLENCRKSIGGRKYAFNTLQLQLFPVQYRPPSGTYGSTES